MDQNRERQHMQDSYLLPLRVRIGEFRMASGDRDKIKVQSNAMEKERNERCDKDQ